MAGTFDDDIIFLKCRTVECAAHFVDDHRVILFRIIQKVSRKSGMNGNRTHRFDRHFNIENPIEQYGVFVDFVSPYFYKALPNRLDESDLRG